MNYLEILSWARKGIRAERETYLSMRERAVDGMAAGAGGAGNMAEKITEQIDALDVKLATLEELEEIHNRP